MYNLSNHYENIYQYLKTIIADPRVLYLYPFGSTQPENIEIIRNDINPPEVRGPLFICFDQEPLNYTYNKPFFDYIKDNTQGPYVLVNTERDSTERDRICEEYGFADINYFFHIFAAHDWYRGHEYIPNIINPENRTLNKTYITFNRLTSNERVYRSLFVNELYKSNILDHGYVSFSKDCPDGGAYDVNLRLGVTNQNIDPAIAEEAIANISQLPELRIDFEGQHIPNQSMLLTPLDKLMSSFVFVVTETCYWQSKTHLTEKIFKPIVLKMPFLLLGCAHNLEYLRNYGFKTFSDFWDESYDSIEDPILRMQAVTNILQDLSTMDAEQQKSMLLDMIPVLDHNYTLFNDPNFIKKEWGYLKSNLKNTAESFYLPAPYHFNPKTKQRFRLTSAPTNTIPSTFVDPV
jgi:hypothetical protein